MHGGHSPRPLNAEVVMQAPLAIGARQLVVQEGVETNISSPA